MADLARDENWLPRQVADYAAERAHWKTYGSWLEKVLQAAADEAGVAAIVQARAKTVASFAEKAIRKQHKYVDPRRQLTDLCGARVIVASLEELDPICEFIESHLVIDRENSLDQRSLLRPREFGYRSVHYVVTPRPDLPGVPPEILHRKAEIQVRTILQHAWADIGHDRLYKRRFQIPESWDRDAARIAAMLEEADEMFGRVIRLVDPYHGHAETAVVGTADAAEDELQLLRTTLLHCGNPPPRDLLVRFGQLALALHHDDVALNVLEPFRSLGDPRILHCCGRARCRKFDRTPADPMYAQGLSELQQACALLPGEATVQLAYAEAAREQDPIGSQRAIEAAYAVAPTDPQVMVEFLRLQVRLDGNLKFVRLIRPSLQSAIVHAQSLVAAGINTCLNGLLLAELQGLNGDFEGSLAAAVDALALVHSCELLHVTKRAWESLERATIGSGAAATHWSTVRRLVCLFGAHKFRQPELLQAVSEWATEGIGRPSEPVVMLAGGCNAAATEAVAACRPVFLAAFANFTGTLISGGTTAGIAGLVADIQAAAGNRLESRGYLPAQLPAGVTADARYGALYRTAGHDFSGLEVVQSWIDLVATGIEPQQVSVIGVNGGPIAAIEYRLGLLLGAAVGVVQNSGRAAERILEDERWAARVIPLPLDAATLRVFCARAASSHLSEVQREALGEAIHADYCEKQRGRHTPPDPAMADWDKLPEDLRASNLSQADDIGVKLRAVGLTAQTIADRPIRLYEFTKAQVETLAELEHARWNIERLKAGWRYGPERDVPAKRSPYLVGWDQLDDGVKKWDRDAVLLIPKLLCDAGYEISAAVS